MENLKGHKLKFFIAYETGAGNDIAKHLKRYLEKLKEVEKAFVASEDTPDDAKKQEEFRFNKIKEADYFVILLTPGAWKYGESLREEFDVAKNVKKKNFILPVIIDVKKDEIPEELKDYEWLRSEPFKNSKSLSKEIAREFGKKIKELQILRKGPFETKEEVAREFGKKIEELQRLRQEQFETKEEVAREFDKIKNLKKEKLKFFIAHETDIAHDIVTHLKRYLEKLKEVEEAFVAPEDIPLGVKNEKEYRFKKIREADYFVLILTLRAWEINESLRKEFDVAKKVNKKNFILIVPMKGAKIPDELKHYRVLRIGSFETKEEVAREFSATIKDLYNYRAHESRSNKSKEEKLKLMNELEFVKNIEEIINKNKRIYFYSPVAPVSCLSEGYMNKVVKLLDDAMEKDKSIFLLFSWNATIEKINTLQKTFSENESKNMLLKDMNMLFGNVYLKIIPFRPPNDEGMIFGENSNEALIWWRPANRDKIYVKFVYSEEEIDTITELFNRNYNKELSFDIFSEFSKFFVKK